MNEPLETLRVAIDELLIENKAMKRNLKVIQKGLNALEGASAQASPDPGHDVLPGLPWYTPRINLWMAMRAELPYVARSIDKIVVHCSANAFTSSEVVTIDYLRRLHVDRGWSDVGYHWLIRLDGTLEQGRPMGRPGAHVKGHNKDSIGICLAGGLNGHRPSCAYTIQQKATLAELVERLMAKYGVALDSIKGHNNYVWNDTDGDGIMEGNELLKACPCFLVPHWALTGQVLPVPAQG